MTLPIALQVLQEWHYFGPGGGDQQQFHSTILLYWRVKCHLRHNTYIYIIYTHYLALPAAKATFVGANLLFMVFLTRVEHFNAAHRLFNAAWSDERNSEVFGKCANPNWHGHNYELHVTLKGEPDAETGFIFNAKTLGDIIKEVIVEKVDHKNLNLDVDFMAGKFTSAENFAIGIWNELQPHIESRGATMHSVKLLETHKIYVEYFG